MINVLNALFPKFCLGCSYPGSYLCPRCRRMQLEMNQVPTCHVCKQVVSTGWLHAECATQTHLDGVWAAAKYNDLVAKAVAEIKYNFCYDITSELAELMWKSSRHLDLWQDALLSFVPLAAERERWRGFNQAQLLAAKLSKLSGKSLVRLISRNQISDSQVGKGREQRLQNLYGAFAQRSRLDTPIPQRVVLVDDVMTTGTTLEQCAKVLKQMGVQEVFGMVMGRG